MTIKKGEKTYTVTELKKHWKLSIVKGGLTIEFNVPKESAETFAELERYIAADKTF